jgi:hypothetical protein
MSRWTHFNGPGAGTPRPLLADIMILLTDGSVLVHMAGPYTSPPTAWGFTWGAREWRRLTPDLSKPDPYAQGAWSQALEMQNARQWFSSGVLLDGRVFAIGGEDFVDRQHPQTHQSDSPLGEIFDPQTNHWSPIDKPKEFDFICGDSASCVLPDGRVLFGGPNMTPPNRTAIWSPLNPSLNSNGQGWMEAGLESGASSKSNPCAEETWVLLQDGSVLANTVFNAPNAERYIPQLDRWVPATPTPQSLALSTLYGTHVNEIGPTIVLPSGNAFAIGATGRTAIFKPGPNPTDPGDWTPGPNFPPNTLPPPNTSPPVPPPYYPRLTACDAPACLLPNGKVICMGGTPEPGPNSINPVFLEFDPQSAATTLAKLDVQPPPPINPVNKQPVDYMTFQCWLLILPTGQVLFSRQENTLLIYSLVPDDKTPHQAWRPAIHTLPAVMHRGQSYQITGAQINGLSQAACYGDDGQMATNYPIVLVTNAASGTAQFLRSYNFSTMSIAPGNAVQSCTVDVPTGLPPGAWKLVVIANGIPSYARPVQIT